MQLIQQMGMIKNAITSSVGFAWNNVDTTRRTSTSRKSNTQGILIQATNQFNIYLEPLGLMKV